MSVVASDRSDRASSGYLSLHRTPTGARSPTSSICSFAGSVNSETVIAHNKYLMKTLCLAKKSTSMPDKKEYANLLTAGLGARKWIASLDFDADSFKAAIVNIYPRLASVPSYTLWNVKSDKTFEKLPSTVNTPKRIKAYLGPTFTGSLVIMPSEEISLGPVKIPHHMSTRDFQARTSSSSSRSRDRVPLVPKEEKESSSGYESYQESVKKGRSSNENQNYHHHKMSHAISSSGRIHRQICVTCGRLAKQVGSSGFYDIHNSTTFATADGYMSIAKKVKEMFHLELPRSKILQSDQICRKCFRAMNEIHFLESQLKRSKEEMMTNLFTTMSKINKLEHITREAASSSSDSSTSSLGSLMTAAALNPWIQEARYLIEQRAAAVTTASTESGPAPRPEDPARRSPTKSAQPMAAIFSHNDGRDPRNFVDYSSPQPVFLAPLASFAQPHGRPRSQSPDGGGHRQMAPVLPLNMSMLRSPPGGNREQASPVYPTTSNTAIFLGKPTPFFTQATQGPQSNREEIEERMAAEEEADAKDAANREHAAYIEEALRQHSEAKAASSNNSSRSSSIMGNYTRNQSSSPDSNSPSPPTVNPNPDQVGEPDKDGSTSINDSRRPWKKRYHEVPPQDQPENLEKKRVRVMTKAEKREYQNVENDSSSTGPQSSGGSPPDHEDLASDYSVSPNSEKVDQVNSTEN